MMHSGEIDAVLIATGDRWHALASIHAAKAGKDVYSEKPCGITIQQCQALSDVIRRTGRVFQAGTQRRNLPHFAFACELARTGRLVTVEENPRLCGWGAEIASIVAEELFWDLDGPIVRVTTPHIPLAAANNLEDVQIPNADKIVARVRQLVD